MKYLQVIIAVTLLFLGAAVTIYAQSDDSAPGLLIAEDAFDVTVGISYSVGDEIVRAQVPAQVVLDATNAITSVVAHHGSTVGIFGFEIVEVFETDEEFQYSKYSSFREPTDGNKLVIVAVEVKNLWNETVEGWSLSATGSDSFGNKYDHTHKTCDEMHPGANGRCIFGFEIAEDIELNAMDVSADDHKTFALPAAVKQQN